jgi:murein DD-endopeptidase MepM/ murein hydrolase activator NlpD
MPGTLLDTDYADLVKNQLSNYVGGLQILGDQPPVQPPQPTVTADDHQNVIDQLHSHVNDVLSFGQQGVQAAQQAPQNALKVLTDYADQVSSAGQQPQPPPQQAISIGGAQPTPQQQVSSGTFTVDDNTPTVQIAGAPQQTTAQARAADLGYTPSPPVSDQSAAANGGYVFPLPDFKGPVQDHWGSVLGGSDLFAPRGTPVSAMRGGTVVESGYNAIGGNAVLIKGDDGNEYYYAHFDQAPSVKVGDKVTAGTYLGPVGNTGDASGGPTHLHIGIGPDIKLGADKYGGTGGDYDAVGLLQRTLDNTANAPAPTTSPLQTAKDAASNVVQAGAQAIGQGKDAFLNSLGGLAQQASRQTGIDPATYLAIAANETGWGRSQTAQQQNNLFSIQGTGANGSRWAGYDSPAAAFDAFNTLISTAPRYAQAWADRANPQQFIDDLRKAGYVVDEPGFPAQGWVDQVKSIYQDIQKQGVPTTSTQTPTAPLQVGDQTPPPARQPIYMTTNQSDQTPAGAAPSPLQIIQDTAGGAANRVAQTAQDLLPPAGTNPNPLPGRPGGLVTPPGNYAPEPGSIGTAAVSAAQGAASVAGATAQDVVQAVQQAAQQAAPNLGFDDQALAARRAALAQDQQVAAGWGGEASTGAPGAYTPQNIAGALAQTLTGPAFGTVQSPQEIRTNTEQVQQAARDINPVRDAFFVGGLTTGLTDMVIQNPLLFVPGAPMAADLGEVGSAIVGDLVPQLGARWGPIVGNLGAQAIDGGIQNVIYELGQPNPSVQSVGEAFVAGAGLGTAIGGITSTPAITRAIGQAIVDRAPQISRAVTDNLPAIQQSLRNRQPAQADVNAALGGVPGAIDALRARGAPPDLAAPGGVQRLPNYTPGTPEAGFEALARASRESSSDGLAHIDLNTVPQDVLPFSTSGEGRGIVKLNPGGMPSLDDLRALYDANAHKRDFYVDQGDSATPLVGAHNAEEYFTLNSINSQQTGLTAQVAESIRTMGIVRQTAADSRAAGDSPQVTRDKILAAVAKQDAAGAPTDMRLSGPSLNTKYAAIDNGYRTGEAPVVSGAKTSVFAGNYGSAEGRMFDPRITNDIHNWRIMNVDSTQVPRERLNKRTGETETFMDTPHEAAVANNDRAYRGVEAVFNELARERGVDGYTFQSAVWDGIRAIQRDPQAWASWQNGDFRGAIRRAQSQGLFDTVSAGPGVTEPGSIAKVMQTKSVRDAIAKYGPILKDPLPSELGIPTVSRTFPGKGPEALRRPSTAAFRAQERAVNEAGAPMVNGLDKATVARLGYDPQRGVFPWLSASHRVVEISPDEYAVHLPAGNVDTARYVAAQVGQASGADRVRVHVPDYRSDDTIGVHAQDTGENIRRLSDALDNMAISHVVGTDGRSLQVPYSRANDVNMRDNVIDAAQSVGMDPAASLAEYVGSTQDVRKSEYAATSAAGATRFAPTTAERSALLQRGVGAGAEGGPPLGGRQTAAARLPFAANLGGAAVGGLAGNLATPASATTEERWRNIGAGASAGFLGTGALTRALESGAFRRPTLGDVGTFLRSERGEAPIEPGGRLPPESLGQVQTNRYALREPRPGETPMTQDELSSHYDALDQRLQQVQQRFDAVNELVQNPGQKVERPPWATGFTNDQVAQMARSVDHSPFEPLWWERAGLDQGSGEVRALTQEFGFERGSQLTQRDLTSAELRRERNDLARERQDILSAGDQMINARPGQQFVRAVSDQPTDLPFEAGPTEPGVREGPVGTADIPAPEATAASGAGGGRDEGARLAQEIVTNKGRLRSDETQVVGEAGGVTGRGITAPDEVLAGKPMTEETRRLMPNLDATIGSDMPEVSAQIQKAVEDNPELFKAYQQGRISWDSLKNDLAQRVGMSKTDWLHTKVGQAFNEREQVALQAAMIESQNRQTALARDIQAKGGVDALSPEETAYSITSLVDAQRLAAVARGGRATAGRSLNALKMRLSQELASGITASNERRAAQRVRDQAARAVKRSNEVLSGTRTLETEGRAAVSRARSGGAPQNIVDRIAQAYDELDRYNAMTLHEKEADFNKLKAEREANAAKRKAVVRESPAELLSALQKELAWERGNFAKRKSTWEDMAFWDSKAGETAAQNRRAFRGGLYIEQQRKSAQLALKQADTNAGAAFDQEMRRRTNQTAKAQRILEAMGGIDVTKKLLGEFVNAINDPDPMVAAKFLQGTAKQSNWLRANTIRIAGLLSSPITHMVNIGGNIGGAMVEVPTRALVVGIDALRAQVTGGERQAYAGELIPMLKAYGPGFLGALNEATRIMQTGLDTRDIADLKRVRPGFNSGNAGVDVAVEAPLRALKAEDAFFRQGAMAAHSMRVATREAIREGFTGPQVQGRAATILKNFVDYPELAAEAENATLRQVFQERRTIPGLASGVPQNEAARLAVSQVLPFVQTPANITAQGFGLSPFGIAGVGEAMRGVGGLEGPARGRQVLLAEERAARAVIGSAILGAGLAIGGAGMLTGAYPTDPKEASTLPQGWRPWSLRIGDPVTKNTYYIPLQNLGPMGMPMAMAAIVTDPIHRGRTFLSPEEQTNTATAIGRYIIDNTFLQGVSDFVDMLHDPKTGASKFLEPEVASWGPYSSLARDMQRMFGVASRNPHDGFMGLVEAMEANYPGLSGNVPPSLTPLGDERTQAATGAGRFVPLRYDIERDEPTLAALRSNGVGIPPESKSININGGHIDLSEEERAALQQARGAAIRDTVQRVTSDPSWAGKSDAVKSQTLAAAVSRAGQFAEGQYMTNTLGANEVRRRWQAREVPTPYYLSTAGAA